MNLNIDLDELKDLDFNQLANGPLPYKLLAAALLAAAVVAAGWWFGWRDQVTALERVQAEEPKLKSNFEVRARRAGNLEAYRQQLEEMQGTFGAMLRQLPSHAEVAQLLNDITQTGLNAGLEFELFRPQAEIRREFYAELPVKIRVRGSYHQLGEFASGVANLPRIVTLHDIAISDNKSDLAMDLTAKTYWYLEEGGRK